MQSEIEKKLWTRLSVETDRLTAALDKERSRRIEEVAKLKATIAELRKMLENKDKENGRLLGVIEDLREGKII